MNLDFDQNFLVRDTKWELGELSELTEWGELSGVCGRVAPGTAAGRRRYTRHPTRGFVVFI
jgi:hypothetical protein